LGSVPFVIVGFWAWKAGFVWTGWGFNFVALFVALNWVITTEWGYGNIMPLIACLIAICVRKLQPTYHFKIDETGIRRVAGTHEYFVPWQEVVQIHQYPSTFLIELQKGAMPILYRVLSKDQREGLNLAFQKYRSTANPIIAK